ncbi:BLUF domain-containing protein [Acinetobacter modestus]|uniref:BLUF domain-containing protein n=1 Tax=Acinetobacter modestus TaxID=1776740 RepID=UPI001F4A9536|nr:BLUF domain-containing protein [Acinetobacter modestus]MCH7331604.1 BLUF domain-containing protein [Acinetobacter modestus]
MNIRLCYASSRHELIDDLIEDLSDILTVARDFNSKNEIFGVLYYANNAFFQCLEGEKVIVYELFDRIKADSRHNSILEFNVVEIDKFSFKNWSMKYVQKSSNVDIFFNQIGFDQFVPAAINEENLNQFIDVLLTENQTEVKRKIGLNKRGTRPYL